MTIQVLNFAEKHSPIVARLLNEEYGSIAGFVPFDGERVLSEIKRRDVKVLVAEEDGEVVGLIGSHVHEHSEEHVQWLAADETRNRRAIEDTLVSTIEKSRRGNPIMIMIDEGSPRINDWISRGYKLEPGFQQMSARLDGLRLIPEVAQGIRLRSLRIGEEEKLIATMNTGFGKERMEPGDIEKWKSESPPFTEEWVQVAEADQRIVSAVVAKPDTDYINYTHIKRGYLGPAATLPEFRSKHLATALTARAMNFLFERGFESVRLGTSEQNTASIALLTSLGFKVDNVRKTLRKELKNA